MGGCVYFCVVPKQARTVKKIGNNDRDVNSRKKFLTREAEGAVLKMMVGDFTISQLHPEPRKDREESCSSPMSFNCVDFEERREYVSVASSGDFSARGDGKETASALNLEVKRENCTPTKHVEHSRRSVDKESSNHAEWSTLLSSKKQQPVVRRRTESRSATVKGVNTRKSVDEGVISATGREDEKPERVPGLSKVSGRRSVSCEKERVKRLEVVERKTVTWSTSTRLEAESRMERKLSMTKDSKSTERRRSYGTDSNKKLEDGESIVKPARFSMDKSSEDRTHSRRFFADIEIQKRAEDRETVKRFSADNQKMEDDKMTHLRRLSMDMENLKRVDRDSVATVRTENMKKTDEYRIGRSNISRRDGFVERG